MLWKSIKRLDSQNPNVWKYIFERQDAIAEAVLYRYPTFGDRTVICCSTQSGCPVGCRFCGAGDHFVRSLTSDEIISQPMHLLNDVFNFEGVLPSQIGRLQIMFMSMGEPLLNLSNLERAIVGLNVIYPAAALLVSTSGPRANYAHFRELSAAVPTVGLQFSVHESTDAARNRLIPFAAKLQLEEIAAEGRAWHERTGRHPFFNYCVHADNGSMEDADRLRALFDPAIWKATISVICEREEDRYSNNPIHRKLATDFETRLMARGFDTRVFDPAGQEQASGCGQLWETQAWMKDHPDKARRTAGTGLPVLHSPASCCSADA